MARQTKAGPTAVHPDERAAQGYARAMVACNMTHAEMATVFHITAGTLRKAFKAELKDGATVVMSAVKGKLVQKAMNGDNACMFFLLKTRDGWSGDEQPPIAWQGWPADQFLDSLSTESLDQVIFALRAALNAPAGGSSETEEAGPAGAASTLDPAAWPAD